eukprot:CAMPEP_0196658180 /NCGR_PEP_ID=MMETSP1086-20130531/27827_1 /TAXON_ID=77921 /ORGANISM="Cyanoptyche  gloeocystis , Strain SAG4.97" /LENGTH=245 /DNA_ID=CAMNT_0041991629 /DNA_START=328 /DNA_END=1065 /DNA_ORIENTATION=+
MGFQRRQARHSGVFVGYRLFRFVSKRRSTTSHTAGNEKTLQIVAASSRSKDPEREEQRDNIDARGRPHQESDPVDYDLLRKRMEDIQRQEAKRALEEFHMDSVHDVENDDEIPSDLAEIFILLVHAGSENEGIYSVKYGDSNFVLAFEAEEEATRYATMLEAQDFPVPTVESVDPEEIRRFCNRGGHKISVVPPGSLFMPPEVCANDHDWKNVEGGPKDDVEMGWSITDMNHLRSQLNRLLGYQE